MRKISFWPQPTMKPDSGKHSFRHFSPFSPYPAASLPPDGEPAKITYPPRKINIFYGLLDFKAFQWYD